MWDVEHKMTSVQALMPGPGQLQPPVPSCYKTGRMLGGCRGPRSSEEAHKKLTLSRARFEPASGLVTAAYGLFHPAAHQRPRARLDLRPDRDRLHDGLRY